MSVVEKRAEPAPRAQRQYVAARFPNSDRPYTYHNDCAPFAIGDEARAWSGNALVKVTIVGIEDGPPPFATRAVIRPEAEPQKQPSTEGKDA